MTAGIITAASWYSFRKYSDYHNPRVQFQKAMRSMSEIARATGSREAAQIHDFLSAKAKICPTNVDSLFAIPNKKDTLYILLKQLNESVRQDSLLSKGMMHAAVLMSEFAYHDNVLVVNAPYRLSNRLTALFLLHAGYIHLSDTSLHPMIREVRAREFMGKVIGKLGGDSYRELQRKYRMYAASKGEVPLPSWTQVQQSRSDLAGIFGIEEKSFETKYLAKIFWTSILFKLIDSQQYDDSELAKGIFLSRNIEAGWM